LVIVAEFAYGGYFKGVDIHPGVSEIQLISQVPLGNVNVFYTSELMSQVFSGLFPMLFKIMTYIPWKKVEWTYSRDEFIQVSIDPPTFC
jgi:hypothetical protein